MRSVAPVSCVGEKRGAHLSGRARAPPRITRLLLIDQHSAALPLAYTHPHTHQRTHIPTHPHARTIRRIIYTLHTTCRERAVHNNTHGNNIFRRIVLACSRRQIIISNILWRDILCVLCTLRPRSLQPQRRQKNQFTTRRDFKTSTEYMTCAYYSNIIL